MKIGLALEGGAMRGMFTCGVIDIFMENGIKFDGLSGISAGAIFGCNYKSKQIGRGVRYNKKYGRDPRYFGLRSLILTGNLYGKDFCYHEIIDNLDPIDKITYRENDIDFFVGATDINEAKIRYYNSKEVDERTIEWIRASASMPLVSQIVKIDGYELLDGGMVDPIPYKILEENGYMKNVVVLTQPRDFVKEKTSIIPIMKILMYRYPKIVDAMARRHTIYNSQTAELKEKEKRGEVFVISPETSLNIKRTENNPDELERVYQIGRKVALKNLDAVKNFIS
jgi:predicted patatin/cPLA2 family phospholipase